MVSTVFLNITLVTGSIIIGTFFDWKLTPAILICVYSLFFLTIKLNRQKLFKQSVCLIFINLIILEAILQLLAAFSILPGINMYERTPYARAYYTKEGFSNGFMNRYGWHYPAFDEKSSALNVVIGDSFIDAAQVNTFEHFTFLVANKKRVKNKTDFTAFGRAGFSPIEYFELVKYAHKYFKLKNIFIFLYHGNDYRNINDRTANSSNADLDPYLSSLSDSLDRNHRPLYYSIPAMIRYNCFVRQVYRYAIFKLQELQRESKKTAIESKRSPLKNGLSYNMLTDYQKARPRLQEFIENLSAFTSKTNIGLTLVTIPMFNQNFYNSNLAFKETEADYQVKIESDLEKLLAAKNIDFFKTAHYIRDQNLPKEKIKSFYTTNGGGHLSIDGHQFFAKILKLAYPNDEPNKL